MFESCLWLAGNIVPIPNDLTGQDPKQIGTNGPAARGRIQKEVSGPGKPFSKLMTDMNYEQARMSSSVQLPSSSSSSSSPKSFQLQEHGRIEIADLCKSWIRTKRTGTFPGGSRVSRRPMSKFHH